MKTYKTSLEEKIDDSAKTTVFFLPQPPEKSFICGKRWHIKGKHNMKISRKTRLRLQEVIYDEIMDARSVLKLPPQEDLVLMQLENKIWSKLKDVLKLTDYGDKDTNNKGG